MQKNIFLGLVILFIAGCSNNPAPSSYPYPGVGSTYDIAEVVFRGTDTLQADTVHIVVDAVNQSYGGRDSVSRFVQSIGGGGFNSTYVRYLSSGDIEVASGGIEPGFLVYPFASQRTLTTLQDTMINGELFRDTTTFSGSGSTTETVAGKTFMAQALTRSAKGIVGGVYGLAAGPLTYIPQLYYVGSSYNTLVTNTPPDTTSSSQTLIAYSLK